MVVTTLLHWPHEMANKTTTTDKISDFCIVQGNLTTSLDWYGFLLQKTLNPDSARIQYQLSYPVSQYCANLLLYYDEQLCNITENMTCKQREAILHPENNQIVPLCPTQYNMISGCSVRNETGNKAMFVCKGERSFRSSKPRSWHIAVSRCGLNNDTLTLNYFFNITGASQSCEEDAPELTCAPQPILTG